MGKVFKQIVPHSAECRMGGCHPWVFTIPIVFDPERRDSMGRVCRRGGHQMWLGVRCNDPDCAGRAIVRLDDFLCTLPWGIQSPAPEAPEAKKGGA